MSELQTAKVYEQQEKSIAAVNALAIVERGEVLRQEITLILAQIRSDLQYVLGPRKIRRGTTHRFGCNSG